jgi:hypothetical protein
VRHITATLMIRPNLFLPGGSISCSNWRNNRKLVIQYPFWFPLKAKPLPAHYMHSLPIVPRIGDYADKIVKGFASDSPGVVKHRNSRNGRTASHFSSRNWHWTREYTGEKIHARINDANNSISDNNSVDLRQTSAWGTLWVRKSHFTHDSGDAKWERRWIILEGQQILVKAGGSHSSLVGSTALFLEGLSITLDDCRKQRIISEAWGIKLSYRRKRR